MGPQPAITSTNGGTAPDPTLALGGIPQQEPAGSRRNILKSVGFIRGMVNASCNPIGHSWEPCCALDAFGLERYYRKLGFVDRPHLNW